MKGDERLTIGESIAALRKREGLTQAQLAEKLDVSFQAVSSWERGEYLPETEKLGRLAKVLNTTVSRIVEDFERPDWELHDRVFNEEHMYTYLKTVLAAKNLTQAFRVLPMARDWHAGQTRKGNAGVPYIVHPLTMACHALAMGIEDDEILAAILLHDVVEDCGAKLEDLPVNDDVKKIVRLVSYPEGRDKAKIKPEYYRRIGDNPKASLVKCIGRCNNLSTMVIGFTREKMATYAVETEKYVWPLLENLRKTQPQWSSAAWLLKYQMANIIETVKRLL